MRNAVVLLVLWDPASEVQFGCIDYTHRDISGMQGSIEGFLEVVVKCVVPPGIILIRTIYPVVVVQCAVPRVIILLRAWVPSRFLGARCPF